MSYGKEKLQEMEELQESGGAIGGLWHVFFESNDSRGRNIIRKRFVEIHGYGKHFESGFK